MSLSYFKKIDPIAGAVGLLGRMGGTLADIVEMRINSTREKQRLQHQRECSIEEFTEENPFAPILRDVRTPLRVLQDRTLLHDQLAGSNRAHGDFQALLASCKLSPAQCYCIEQRVAGHSPAEIAREHGEAWTASMVSNHIKNAISAAPQNLALKQYLPQRHTKPRP